MSCGCKSGDITPTNLSNNENKFSVNKIKDTLINSMYFLFVLIIGLPFINIFFIWFLFKTIVVNQNIDITNLLAIVAKKMNVKFNEEPEEDDDDYEELSVLTEDDVVLLDVEDITSKN
jgi:hypothetical protein